MIDCEMIELSVVNSENDIESFELTTNIPADPSVLHSWTVVAADGSIILTDSSSNPIIQGLSPNQGELIVCVDIAIANIFVGELSCSVCQPLMWADNAWVIADEGDEGDEGNEGDEGDEGDEGNEGDEEMKATKEMKEMKEMKVTKALKTT